MISVLDPKREVGLWHSVLTVSLMLIVNIVEACSVEHNYYAPH